MAEGYSLLDKKLEDLKSKVNQVMTLSAADPHHQILVEDIEGRFTFLKRLISAETQSHTQKPHHLHHIAQRLEELEYDFKDRRDSLEISSADHTDTDSPCSCTESCYKDDEVEVEDTGSFLDLDLHHYQDPGIPTEGVIQEQHQVPNAEGYEERKETGLQYGKRANAVVVMCGAVMFTVFLMGVMMVGFCGSFDYRTGLEDFLPPT